MSHLVATNSPLLGRPRSSRLLWLSLVVAFALLSVGGLVCHLYLSHTATQSISRVLVQELQAPNINTTSATAWQAVQLPQKLCQSECTSRFKLYEHKFAQDLGASEAKFLYLPMFDGAAEVYLNGALISVSGSVREPYVDTTYQPLGVELPRHLLHPKDNQLQVLIASVLPRGGRLAAFYMGTAESVQPLFALARFLTVDILQVLLGVACVLALCALLLYMVGDRDRIYIWFVGLLLFISLRYFGVLVPSFPDTPIARHGLYLMATFGVVLTAAGFVSRLAERVPTKLDLLLLVLWLPLSVGLSWLLYVDFWHYWALANQVIGITTLILGCWILVRFVRHTGHMALWQQAMLLGLLCAGVSLILHDVWFSLRREVLLFQLSNLAAVPIMGAFCIALAARHGQQIRLVRSANVQLSSAIAQTRQELHRSFEQLREHERRDTLRDERQRLLQDVHDGVGGRLAATAMRLRQDANADPQTAFELEQSVQDLRLIIESLDETSAENLSFALGSMRERTDPWLAQHGLAIDWDIAFGSTTQYSSAQVLTLCRILQEAISNVVRHAQADTIAISVHQVGNTLRLEVADNGVGFSEQQSFGRGLRNMQSRSQSLQGALEVHSDASGTRVRLTLPTQGVGRAEPHE